MKKRRYMKILHIFSFLAVMSVLSISAFAYIVEDEAYIDLPGMEHTRIGQCFYVENFGFECPSCGMTRSFISIAHFQWEDMLRYHRIGIFLYIAAILFAFYNLLFIFEAKLARPIGIFLLGYTGITCIAIIINYLLKMVF